MQDDLVYLASPYTHADKAVMEDRFRAACRYAACLMRRGINVFSPIAHSHPIAQFGLPPDWQFWRPYGEKWLSLCTSMIVLMLPGWQVSEGVQAETDIMWRRGRRIEWHTEDGVVFQKRIKELNDGRK